MFNERRIISIGAYALDSRSSLITGIVSNYFIIDDYSNMQAVNNQFWREVLNKAQSNFS